jgi:hypothetical protein
MPFSFPSNPSIGQQSTQNGRVYSWTGSAWELVATSGLAAVATSGSASDLASGTLPSARFPNTITIPGSGTGGAIEFVGNNSLSPLSPVIRIRNAASSSPNNTIEIGVGNPTGFDGIARVAFAGRDVFYIEPTLSTMQIKSGLSVFSNTQIVNANNANAYINLNNGAGTLQISALTAMEFQKSYVVIGRWDTHGAFHIGANNTVAGATTNGGVLVAGAHARSRLHGQMVTSGGRFASTGDAQSSTYHLRHTTTDATATTLFLEGSSARLTIPAQSTWSFIARIAAYNSTDNEGAAWVVRGAIRRNNAGGTALLGTLQTDSFADTNMATAAIAVTADDTNEALQINVTGIASKTIRWHAVVETSEVCAGAAT